MKEIPLRQQSDYSLPVFVQNREVPDTSEIHEVIGERKLLVPSQSLDLSGHHVFNSPHVHRIASDRKGDWSSILVGGETFAGPVPRIASTILIATAMPSGNSREPCKS